MIKSFKCRKTKILFEERRVDKKFSSFARKALIKLEMIYAAEKLEDLLMPPANRLEKLLGNRKDQYSIRINDQWRICFTWNAGDADEVEIVDYH